MTVSLTGTSVIGGEPGPGCATVADVPGDSASRAAPRLVVSVDIGGTSLKGALVDADLAVVRRLRRPTVVTADPQGLISAVADLLGALARGAPVAPGTAGVVAPGVVDEARGRVIFSANLRWADVDLAEPLGRLTGVPVAIGHDVRAGALAEVEIGAARGASSALFVPIGTGVAGAFVADGRALSSDGYAGEIGHIVVDPAGVPCGCGGRGCLETVASAAALARKYTELSGTPVSGAAEVCARVAGGDEVARRVWESAIDALAEVLAAAVSLLGPEVIVIGGGLSGAGEALLQPLRERLAGRLTFQRMPRVVRAGLGDQAACLGAAILAQRLAVRPL